MRPGRRGAAAFAVVLTGAAVCGWAGLAGADPPTGAVASFAIGTTGSTVQGIVGGPDGNVWYVEPGAQAVGTVVGGVATEFAIPGNLPPLALAEAKPGTLPSPSLWLLQRSNSDGTELRELSTAGTLTPAARFLPAPVAIATDANGNVWLANPIQNAIDEVKASDPTTGLRPDNNVLTAGAAPASITAGPDGQTMWFTEPGLSQVGSIDQGGVVHEYPLPVSGVLGNIVLGADGNLWVGVIDRAVVDPSYVVRITPAGVTSQSYTLPSNYKANVDVLASGPDGRLWMADEQGDGLGGLTALTITGADGGTFTPYPGVLTPGDFVSSIVADPGGADALWMTDQTANTVERVNLQAPTSNTGETGATSTTGPSSTNGPTGATAPPPPPAVTPALAPVSDVGKSGAVLHGTISLPAGSSPTSVSYHFEYGISTAYGSSTPPATATATPAGVSVSATLSGLDAFATYHYRLVATDCGTPAIPACEGQSADQSFTTGSTLDPVEDSTVGAAPTSGEILIKLPGHHGFKRLPKDALIPLGSTVDARHGGVLIESSTGGGEQASGRFSGGVFKVTQPKGGTATVLVLVSSFATCSSSKPTAAPLARAASAKKKTRKKSHKVVNQVFGNAHGQYATQGQYATAADQGTSWRVSDRCDGTQIAVISGKVTVTDFVHHHTFVLKGGQHYLAPGH